MHEPDDETQPQLNLRLTGNRRDIRDFIAALDTQLNTWRINIEVTKPRIGGTAQTYATATKEEKR